MTSARPKSRQRAPLDVFLEIARQHMTEINSRSAIVRLEPLGDPADHADAPSSYRVLFQEVQHFERAPDGRVVSSSDPLEIWLGFPGDYLIGVGDPPLHMRIAHANSRLVHPNFSRGVFCLGDHFRPGTRLEGVVEQLYLILSSQVFATEDAFDRAARDFYLDNPDRVRALVSPPLFCEKTEPVVRVSWRERAARRESEGQL